MTVHYRFFSVSRDLAETGEMSLDIPPASTVHDALQILFATKPNLKQISPSCLYAIGNDYAPMTARLEEGNTISIIPPVQGG